MNSSELTYLLNKPNAINDKHTLALERIVDEFPYFQSSRALHLKGLYNQDSFKYNQALRITAAYTTDRSILFDFITSGNFVTLQKTFLEEKEAVINSIIVNESELVVQNKTEPTIEKALETIDKLEQSILTSIKEATPEIISENTKQEETSQNETGFESIEEKLEIGKPLDFSKEEKHSFQEWLQLASLNPINRESTPIEEKTEEKDLEKKKKLEIIDKFIEANPKISPIKTEPTPIILQQTEGDTSYLMTETLAKVYLEQKKYQKAIQAYEILILKYPEKSSLFADRISDIKFLQQNNN